MNYKIIWQPNSVITFEEEIDFIFRKWNYKEVNNFQELVVENLIRLSKNPKIGIYNFPFQVYTLVISKQTTLYYSFDEERSVIDLLLFWNNLKNPEDLEKYL